MTMQQLETWLRRNWRLVLVTLVLTLIFVGFALILRWGIWALLGLVLAFVLGLLVCRATLRRPASPSKHPTLTLCGPVTAPLTLAIDQPGSIAIAQRMMRVASGTTLDNGGLAAATGPQLCLTGTLNGAGQLISGRLVTTPSPAKALSYRGPMADLPLTVGQPTQALSLSGWSVPLAANAALDGSDLLSQHLSMRSLTAELDDTGAIAHGKVTRAATGDASRLFWLELLYLAFLLGIALLYLYPGTSPGVTFTAKLTGTTSVLLKSASAAKLTTPLMLIPTGNQATPTRPSGEPSIPKGADITVGPSTSRSPISISRSTILLSPGADITIPDKTMASFNQNLPISWQALKGHSAPSMLRPSLQLVGPAAARLATRKVPAELSVAPQSTSTVWDNFLLWLQDLRHWLRRVFPNSLGPIPLAIFWLGALGSVVRGLSSAIGSSNSTTYPWYYNSDYWHIARPIIGAAFALFTYLFFLSILDPKGTGSVGGQYGTFLLAFVVGYSDGTFAALIERTINVLLGPGDPNGPHAG